MDFYKHINSFKYKFAVILVSGTFLNASIGMAVQVTNQPYENALKSFYTEDLTAAVIHLKNALKNNPKHLPSRILMAEILIEQGDGAGAEIELEFAEQGKADDKKILPLMLEAYLLQNKYEQVIEKAIPITGNSRLASEILLLKGRALFSKNNPTLALIEYKKSYQLDNRNADALLGIAQVALKRNQYDDALANAEQTLVIDPLNTNAMQMKAGIFQLRGEIEQAIKSISNAITINNKHFPALLTRAGIYIEQEKFAEALIDVEVVLTDIPNEPRANYLKAVISQALGMEDELKKTASHLDVVLTGMPEDVMQENPIYFYLAGLVNFNQRDYIKSQDDLRNYLEIISDDVRALKLISKVELILNEPFSAKNYLVKARLIDPNDVEIWTMLGRSYFATGEFEKAQRYFEDVIEELPDSSFAFADLAKLQMAVGQTQKAILSFSKARELSPENIDLSFDLSQAYRKVKQFDKALELIEAMLESQTNSTYLHQQKGILLGGLGKHSAARNSFEKAYQLDNDNIAAVVHLARIDVISGVKEAARSRIQSSLNQYPDNPVLLVELGDTYSKKSEISIAQRHYEKAYSLNRDNTLSVSKVLSIHTSKGDFVKAIEVASEYLSRINNDAAIHQKIAGYYVNVKNYAEAVNSYQLAVRHAYDKASILVDFASSQIAMRDPQGAISSLQKAIAWNEDFFTAHFKLIDLYAVNNEQQKALDLVNQLGNKLNMPALLMALTADVYLATNEFSIAEKYYKDSLVLDKSQKATLGLSESLQGQNKFQEAVALLGEWQQIQPDNMVSAIALADVYVKLDQLSVAQKLYLEQIERSGPLPVLLNNAAIINISLGNTEDALELAKQAYSQFPGNVAIMDTMAWTLTKSEQANKALPIFRDALAIDSDNAEIKYHLAVNLVQLKREAEAIRYLKEALSSGQKFNELKEAEALLAELLG